MKVCGAAMIVIGVGVAAMARADAKAEKPVDQWSKAAIANVGSFYANGDYAVFNAGIGFGVAYRFHSKEKKYLHEIGVYMAPQVSGQNDQSAASVAALVHWNFIEAAGIGIGYRFWEDGDGMVEPKPKRVFITVGFGLTGSSSEAAQDEKKK